MKQTSILLSVLGALLSIAMIVLFIISTLGLAVSAGMILGPIFAIVGIGFIFAGFYSYAAAIKRELSEEYEAKFKTVDDNTFTLSKNALAWMDSHHHNDIDYNPFAITFWKSSRGTLVTVRCIKDEETFQYIN